MPLVIATQASPAYSQRVRLDGVYFTLRLRWNERAAVWILDLLDAVGEPIVLGVAVRTQVPLNEPGAARHPAGMLWAQDTSGSGADAGFAELGGRVALCYLEAAELAAFRA